ncbi:MAG: MutS-related protein [Bacilli bacterium]
MKVDLNQIGVKHFLDKVDCKSQYGKLALKNLKQLNNTDILAKQKLLLEVINLDMEIKNNARNILSNIKNITLILKTIKNKTSVDIVDLHEVKTQAMHVKQLEKLFDQKMFDFNDIDEIIKILDPNNENKYSFRLYECYDSELAQIVKQKREIEHRYYNSDVEMKESIMQERDKIVLAEKIRMEVVIQKIVNSLAIHIDKMIHNCEILTECDLMIAKSIVYVNYQYCISEFADSFDIKKSFFPLVSDEVNNYTPLSIKLERGSTLVVGANMGGKSTILKNLAFNTYLVNYGFLPLAEKFVMPKINNIIFMQSFEDTAHGLSRFGSEIKMLNKALDSLDEQTLFLIDEFASSTNPSEGYLFVKSLINYCSNIKSYTVLTSHYDNLSKECETYVVCGINEDNLDSNLNLSDLMNYEIEKTIDNAIPKQAMIVAKYMDVNNEYLNILKNNYKKEEQNEVKD